MRTDVTFAPSVTLASLYSTAFFVFLDWILILLLLGMLGLAAFKSLTSLCSWALAICNCDTAVCNSALEVCSWSLAVCNCVIPACSWDTEVASSLSTCSVRLQLCDTSVTSPSSTGCGVHLLPQLLTCRVNCCDDTKTHRLSCSSIGDILVLSCSKLFLQFLSYMQFSKYIRM